MSGMQWARLILAIEFLLPAAVVCQTHTVSQSVHNLSSTGPGTVKSSNDVGVCIFCHVPHGGVDKHLWNKQLPADYDLQKLYTSSTYVQTNNQISERSKLCLSCHDGTIALGQTVATGDLGVTKLMAPSNYLGTDLRRDHPISFSMPARDDGEIATWLLSATPTSPDPNVKLRDGMVECTTCHDPHVPDNDPVATTKFLVRSNQNGGLCLNCHDPNRGDLAGYTSTPHSMSQSTVSLAAGLTYSTVGENSCMSCHSSHNAAGTGPRLLRAVEESNCITCHGPSPIITPAPMDVFTGLSAAGNYKHPVMSVSGVHDTGEALPVNSARHSECEDCHNPHRGQPNAQAPIAPAVQSPMLGSKGVGIDGSVKQPAANEYEVCLKCHGNSNNKPQKKGFDADFGRTAFRQSMIGQADPYNAGYEFNSTIARHNVSQSRTAAVVPSLRPFMLDVNGNVTTRSLATGNIYCSDCHNSDQNRSDGGAGVNGPHFSSWQHLLERRYDTNLPAANPGDPVGTVVYISGKLGSYAMCDKCHDVDGKLVNGGDTVFGLHNRHVVLDGLACSSCHSGHGIQGSDSTHHGNLVDPDTAIVRPVPGSTGDTYINTTSRTCNLVCHGHTHTDKTY
jgi:predicted CXXCH cytochrome family protein